ncbi:MAG: hypothetical protein K2L49_02900 [Muribaculaceae bacterium]|nr:hypothetical protein [Muribaculaceae bacterium]
MNDIITFNPAMQPTDSCSSADSAEMCVNLRLSTEGSSASLSPTGEPRKICDATMAEPYCRFTDSGGHSSLLFLEDLNLYRTSALDNGRTCIATLPSKPGAAIADGDTLKIMTPEGVRHITADPTTGDLTDRGIMPHLPDIRFVTHSTATVTATLPTIKLAGGYNRCTGTLSGSDTSMLSKELGSMYENIYAQAAGMGLTLQPRLMAWRLLDGKGNELTRSVPVWVAPGGFQCIGSITGTITKDENGIFSTLTGIKAEASAYATRVRIDGIMADQYWRSQCRTLQIVAGPQLHTVATSGMTVARLDGIDSATGQLTAHMPGTGAGNTPPAMHAEIADAIALFDLSAEVIAEYDDPFGSDSYRQRPLPVNAKANAATERNSWQNLRKKQQSTSIGEKIMALSASPNGFMAGTVHNSGDTTILADITPLRHKGFTPSIYSVTPGVGKFRQVSHIEYGTDGSAAAYSSADDDAPERISPVIVTPFPDAKAITLTVEHNGTTRSERFALNPSACGRYSYHIADNLDSRTMPESTAPITIPPVHSVTSRYGGALTVSHPCDPFTPISAIDFGSSPIVAVTVPAGSASAWDFARRHMTVWSADAIRTLSVNCSRRQLSACVIHPCGPSRHDAVAVTPHGIYAALDNGQVIQLKGSKVAIPFPGIKATATGYCATLDELWTTDTDGNVTVIGLRHDNCVYRRTFGPVHRLHADSGRLYAAGISGLYDASDEDTDNTSPIVISWVRRMRVDRHRHLRRLTIWLQSPQASVTAELRGDGGAGASESLPLLTVHAQGQINAPLSMRMASPWSPYITLRLSGTLAPGSSLSGAEVECIK